MCVRLHPPFMHASIEQLQSDRGTSDPFHVPTPHAADPDPLSQHQESTFSLLLLHARCARCDGLTHPHDSSFAMTQLQTVPVQRTRCIEVPLSV